MKKRKKTIVEENKGSLSKKIGKYAVIVVLYIALVSTLAFIMSTISLIVNADSSTGFSTWKNAYSPSSIEIATINGNIICGSNDVFESNSSNDNLVFDDYFSVAEETEIEDDINYIYVQNNNAGNITTYTFNVGNATMFNQLSWPLYDVNNSVYLNVEYLYGQIRLFIRSYQGSIYNNGNVVYAPDDIIYDNVYTANVSHSGSSIDGMPGIEGPSASISYNNKNDNIITLSSVVPFATSSDDISIKRVNNATYNSNGYYDVVSSIDSDIITNFYLSFTRDFVVKYSDFSSGEYRYDYQSTDEFIITKGYYLNYYDVSGVLQRVNINSSMSYDSNDIVSLLPTLNEITLEIGEDNINQSDIYLIEDLYVQISCPLTSGSSNNHTFYWVGVNNSRYSTIVNDLPNQFWKTTEFNVGEFLLDSANSFLSFELIPGFSLLSLLALVIGIPLLIYILKLFLGG